MTFILKDYQERILFDLRKFFAATHDIGTAAAYAKIARGKDEHGNLLNPYYSLEYKTFVNGLEDRPHVCVRVPTAGGKTYMATCALPLLAEYRAEQLAKEGRTDNLPPIILWMMPRDMIRSQTINMLDDISHPCGRAVRDAFNYNMRVCGIEDFDNLLVQDFTDNGIIIVSTAQMFRITNTSKRQVYAHKENFDLHFSQFSAAATDSLEMENGRPKHSFVNLLHMTRPIVVCDEAHDFVSALSQEVLRRINPACIVEWTATPRQRNNNNARENIRHNVLANATAADLQKEEMIKMPVRVGEHDDWEQAVQAAVLERARLQQIAAEHDESIRPIALYKATNINGEVPPSTLKKHLMNAPHHIPEHEIAIATGDIKELKGVDLLAADCKINHIITVEALREGWDCAFVYVLCSVANAQSSGAAEQLLGRIMRMPYAQQRRHPDLNRAYVHMPSDYSSAAVEILRKNLALEQGYEESEANRIIQHIIPGTESDNEQLLTIAAKSAPDFSRFSADLLAKAVEIQTNDNDNYTIIINRPVALPVIEEIVAVADVPEAKKSYLRQQIQHQVSRMRHRISPIQNGVLFKKLPQFILFSPEENAEVVADCDSLYELAEWNRIGENCLLEDFSIADKGAMFEIVTQDGQSSISTTRRLSTARYSGRFHP